MFKGIYSSNLPKQGCHCFLNDCSQVKSGKRPGPLIRVNNNQLRAISEAIVISAFHDKHRQESMRTLSLEAELEPVKW